MTKKKEMKQRKSFLLYAVIVAGVLWQLIWAAWLIGPRVTDIQPVLPFAIGALTIASGWGLILAKGYKWLPVFVLFGAALLFVLSYLLFVWVNFAFVTLTTHVSY